jgi:hypothetical protein
MRRFKVAKKNLTYGQHLELGPRIKEARKLLMDAQLRICNGMGTSKKPCRAITQMLNILDLRLKNQLDDIVFEDFPEKDSEEKRGIYYGPAERDRVALLQRPFDSTDKKDVT